MLQQPKRKKVGSELESNNEGISETPSDIVLPATARPGASGIDISTSTSDVMAAVSKSTEPAGILSVATAINTSSLSNAKVNEATSVKNVDVNEQLDVPTTVYKKNPNDQGQNLEDADNSETERIDAQEALLIRRRAMNTIHSRRKRERQRIEIEVLKEQCSEYTKKNLLIQQENTQLEVIIANAKATVEQRERLGAMNISLFQQHQQQQLMPQQQQQQQLHQPQQSVYNTAPMSIMPQSQQQNSTASLLQLLQQQMNQSLQGSVNTMYVPSVQQQMQQHQPVYNNPPIHNQMVQHQVSATGNNIVQSEHQYADQIHNAIRQQITLLQQQQQPNVVAHGLANTDASTSNAAASIQNIVQQLAMNNTSGSGNNDNVPGSHSLQYHQYQHQQQNQAMMMPQQMSTQQQQQLLLAQQWYLQQQIQLQLQQQQLPPSHQNQDRNYNADTGAPSNPP